MKQRFGMAMLIAGVLIGLAGCATTAPAPATEASVESVKEAAERAALTPAQVDIIESHPAGPGATLVIRTHVLPGRIANDPDTRIAPGDATEKKLTQRVEDRTAQVLRAVITEADLPDVRGILVETRHGVLATVGHTNARPTSIVIYEVYLPKHAIKSHDWKKISDRQIKRLWKVRTNLIPKLKFQ